MIIHEKLEYSYHLANLTYNNLKEDQRLLFDSNKCILYDGPIDARLMIITRDLGKDELEKEVPLIGAAGSLVRFALAAYDKEAFLCNTVPFKPISNTPFPQEIRNKFKIILDSIIDIVNPKAIVTLGLEAYSHFNSNFNGSILGRVQEGYVDWVDKKNGKRRRIYPACHPAFLIRKGITINTLKERTADIDMFKQLFFKPIYKAYNYSEGKEE